MADVYREHIPANANISIDYKDRSVSFEYPNQYTYRRAVWKFTLPTLQLLFANSLIIPLIYLFVYLYIPYAIIHMIFYPSTMASASTTPFPDIPIGGLTIVGGFIYVVIIPFIITLYLSLNKERLSKYAPKIGYYVALFMHMKKEKVFKIEDVSDENTVTIPYFMNVYLRWEADGEFSDYLEKVNIKNHDFMCTRRIFLLPFIKREFKNENDFSAVFTFSEKPKTGELKAIFM